MRLLAPLLVVAAFLAGCESMPGGGIFGPSTPALPTVASEQRRLAGELRGTPVVVETTSQGRLRVAVPLEFSFDPGRSAVKPAAGAVLKRMATGLKQQPAFEVRIAAPADGAGAGGRFLAQDRAASARDYLVANGVPVVRFTELGRTDDAVLELLVGERAVPASKPTAATRTTSP
jgi:outer membrane protein OmpA-like peptidoglycan-associated protein